MRLSQWLNLTPNLTGRASKKPPSEKDHRNGAPDEEELSPVFMRWITQWDPQWVRGKWFTDCDSCCIRKEGSGSLRWGLNHRWGQSRQSIHDSLSELGINKAEHSLGLIAACYFCTTGFRRLVSRCPPTAQWQTMLWNFIFPWVLMSKCVHVKKMCTKAPTSSVQILTNWAQWTFRGTLTLKIVS